jgi:hypothetical protein
VHALTGVPVTRVRTALVPVVALPLRMRAHTVGADVVGAPVSIETVYGSGAHAEAVHDGVVVTRVRSARRAGRAVRAPVLVSVLVAVVVSLVAVVVVVVIVVVVVRDVAPDGLRPRRGTLAGHLLAPVVRIRDAVVADDRRVQAGPVGRVARRLEARQRLARRRDVHALARGLDAEVGSALEAVGAVSRVARAPPGLTQALAVGAR